MLNFSDIPKSGCELPVPVEIEIEEGRERQENMVINTK